MFKYLLLVISFLPLVNCSQKDSIATQIKNKLQKKDTSVVCQHNDEVENGSKECYYISKNNPVIIAPTKNVTEIKKEEPKKEVKKVVKKEVKEVKKVVKKEKTIAEVCKSHGFTKDKVKK